MAPTEPTGVHLITGGFPPGSFAGHDMDYVRLTLLQMLSEHDGVRTSVGNDYRDVATWLPVSRLLITYSAGPFPDPEQNSVLREWLEAGGRWVALHGTTGGKAVRLPTDSDDERPRKKMVRLDHHETLGGFFLNHPPLRRFTVDVTTTDHPITTGLPSSFATADELYLVELTDPESTTILLTTDLPTDPAPGFGFWYEKDTALQADGRSRVLGYTRDLGAGAVTYLALGHTHTPANNSQPFVDESVAPDGTTPKTFRGSWETPEFQTLLHNSITWGLDAKSPAATAER